MASESPISQLAAQPLKNQVVILCFTMVVLFGLYHQLYYSSMQEELENAEAQYTRHEQQGSDLKKKEIEWKKMIQEKEALDVKLSTNQVSLPRTSDLPSFIGHLQRQAAVAGVTFRNWSRKDESAVQGYVKVPVAVEVYGSFHQLLKYYYLLGKTKRIITIEDFSFEPIRGTSDVGLLKANFRATTFRQADGAAPPASEAPPPKSGMVDKAKDARAKKEAQVEAVTGGKTDEQGTPVPKSGFDRLKKPGAE